VELKNKSDTAIIWETGTKAESLRHYLNNILGGREIKELPANSHIGHCTHTAGSAGVEMRNIQHVK
jgi:hypothetical protein